MSRNTLLPVLALSALIGLAGCASRSSSEFYQLQGSSEQQQTQHSQQAVLLGPVRVADYLQRETLVQRQLDGRVEMSHQARWAGSLEDEVGQLLLRELSMQLANSHLALYPDRVGLHPQQQLVLSINRLDSGPELPATLQAQWRVLDGTGATCDSGMQQLSQAHQGDLTSQVQAQSQLLVQLAQQLASKLKGCN